jgi:hypothetical protein
MREVLAHIHNIATSLENKKAFKQADKLNNIFIKLAEEVEAAKKKKKTKKNVPTNPDLWAQCKAWAKRTFDIYPSAYANGAAAKRYKAKGGSWKKASNDSQIRVAEAHDDIFIKLYNLIDHLDENMDDSSLDEIKKLIEKLDHSDEKQNLNNHEDMTIEAEMHLEDALNNFDSGLYLVDPHGDWREDEWISIEEYIELLEKKFGDNILDAPAAIDANHIAFESPDGFQVINLVHKSMLDTGDKGPIPDED